MERYMELFFITMSILMFIVWAYRVMPEAEANRRTEKYCESYCDEFNKTVLGWVVNMDIINWNYTGGCQCIRPLDTRKIYK